MNLDMDNNKLPLYSSIHTIIFDFDGVFTNNKVYVSQQGIETVVCNRSDGLGLDILRAFKKKYNWNLSFFIVSTEKNDVVIKRSDKLKIPCFYGVKNKYNFLQSYLRDNREKDLSGIIYLGNDLNDLEIMKKVGYSIAPQDAHPLIKSIASKVLPKRGGEGFVRFFIEELLRINENQSILKELI